MTLGARHVKPRNAPPGLNTRELWPMPKMGHQHACRDQWQEAVNCASAAERPPRPQDPPIMPAVSRGIYDVTASMRHTRTSTLHSMSQTTHSEEAGAKQRKKATNTTVAILSATHVSRPCKPAPTFGDIHILPIHCGRWLLPDNPATA